MKDNLKSEQQCPVCCGTESRVFYEIEQVPVFIGVLWPSRDEALACPKGDVRLLFCPECGFIHNRAFDATLTQYSQNYNNSLHFSPVYDAYARASAQRIIERYGVTGKTVMEIGCGKGDFLSMLCRLGENRGIGFDQSYEDNQVAPELSGRLTFINDLFGPKYSGYQADLICSRYVLEHIPQPVAFMQMLRATVAADSSPVFYFEVPNAELILSQLSIWDIIYEHCSYFNQGSLTRVFEVAGFTVINTRETFGGQFVSLEATPTAGDLSEIPGRMEELYKLENEVDLFPAHCQSVLGRWRDTLSQVTRSGKKTILWGAGAKGVSFLNLLNVSNEIEYVVDINPAKHGKYLPGSGQQVVSPEFLKEYRPDTVMTLNPVYRDEIQGMLNELGLEPRIFSP